MVNELTQGLFPGARSDLTGSGRALQVIVRRIIFPSAGIHLTE